MDTPISQRLRTRHTPTPKMSDRKKTLFKESRQNIPVHVEEDSDLGPMSPLKFSVSPQKFSPSVLNKVTSFRNILGNISPSSDRSLSPDFEKRFSHTERYELLPAVDGEANKENEMSDEETRLSFGNSTSKESQNVSKEMRLIDETNSNSLSHLMTTDLNLFDKKQDQAALHKTPQGNENSIPKLSFKKFILHDNGQTPSENVTQQNNDDEESDKKVAKARTSLSFSCISSKSFYSATPQPRISPPHTLVAATQKKTGNRPALRNSAGRGRIAIKKGRLKGTINRGVYHNIKKSKKKKPKLTILNNSALKTYLAEYANKIEEQDKTQFYDQIKKLKDIFKNTKNPIDMARPLSLSKSMTELNNGADSSTEEEDEPKEEEENDENKPANKFFKSRTGKKLKREYKLINNLSATIKSGGKISLNKMVIKKRKLKSLFDEDFDFEMEQTEVNNIIKNLDKSAANASQDRENIVDDILKSSTPYKNPSNAIEKSLSAQVQEVQIAGRSQNNEDDSSSNKLFSIFYKNHCLSDTPKPEPTFSELLESSRKRQKTMAATWKSIGSNQYQIDAGQKAFGAKNCSECGFLYSANEPEDEKEHQKFHDSRQMLQYKRFANEIVVGEVLAWGVSGKIICLLPQKDKEKSKRVEEILKLVDQELGYYDHVSHQPLTTVYLAVAKSVILGVCVVEPLSEAYRLLSIEGTESVMDFFSSATYPVKCGISRIWVSPFYRRQGVAKTLITALKSHYIFGYQMSFEEIAFSSPTQSGKELAQYLTGRNDFLVY